MDLPVEQKKVAPKTPKPQVATLEVRQDITGDGALDKFTVVLTPSTIQDGVAIPSIRDVFINVNNAFIPMITSALPHFTPKLFGVPPSVGRVVDIDITGGNEAVSTKKNVARFVIEINLRATFQAGAEAEAKTTANKSSMIYLCAEATGVPQAPYLLSKPIWGNQCEDPKQRSH